MQRWDPIIPARLASFRRPVYVRLFAHASLLTAEDALEVGIRKTFDVWQASAEQPLRFWDVGTNIGIFTFTLGSAHHDAEIISFEPDPRNLECLRRSMKAWQLPAHLLVAAAVSDRSGRASFTTDLLSGATGALSEIPSTFNELHYCHQGEVRDVEVLLRRGSLQRRFRDNHQLSSARARPDESRNIKRLAGGGVSALTCETLDPTLAL